MPATMRGMKTHQLLGQLSSLNQMMAQLLLSLPEAEGYHRFDPQLPPLAWLVGRAAYLESYWIREVVQQDPDRSARVRHLFGHGVVIDERLIAQLPPRDHLLNWALELHDQHLTWLANPGQLPAHPLLQQAQLLPLLLQQQAALYEQMLQQLAERALQQDWGDYPVAQPLQPHPPSADHAVLHKGHYRIGARHDDRLALARELPPQMVQLDAFRIDRQPVSNGAWLAFIEAGGYQQAPLWESSGWQWQQQQPVSAPHHWRTDRAGHWYAIGLNGPYALTASDAVSGVTRHEAIAYSHWVAAQGGELAGAVLQHEYQWEVAQRAGALQQVGTVREWCSNPYHDYSGYVSPEWIEAQSQIVAAAGVLRGSSLHSQPLQRRSSYREAVAVDRRNHVSGLRLVFPAATMPWETSETGA